MILWLLWAREGCLSKFDSFAVSRSSWRDVLTDVWCRIGSPRELYRAKGDFYSMVKHSGEDEELQDM